MKEYRTHYLKGKQMMKTLFANGFVYDTESRSFRKRDLLVERNGIITDADYHGEEIEDTVDCTGKYIIPGLVDVHTHGRGGYDFNTADAAGVLRMRRSYAQSGTTTVFATLASETVENLYKSFEAIKPNRVPRSGTANIAGIHLEGRYLNPKRRGAHPEHLLVPLNCEELKQFLEAMKPAPMRVSAAVEMEGGEEFIKAALAEDAVVAIAHSDATYEEAVRCVELGVTGFTHTFNAMSPLHHRKPGCIAASLMTDSAYTELICDGEHIHPEMISMASRLKPEDKVVLITDSMEAAGCEDGEYAIAGQPVIVKDGKALTLDGAIAGSTLDLFTGMKNYMKFTGKTLEEVIPAATSNPADMMGIGLDCGRIAEGYSADMLVLTNKENPEIESVWIGGEKIER